LEIQKYLGLGKIKEDQVIDYAKRRSISTDTATKWLSPNIAEKSCFQVEICLSLKFKKVVRENIH
jgi:hypothetical protein